MSRNIKLCKAANCQDTATTSGYCRIHYLKLWQKIKEEEKTEKKRGRKRGRKPKAEKEQIKQFDADDDLEARAELLDVEVEPGSQLEEDLKYDINIDDILKNIEIEDY